MKLKPLLALVAVLAVLSAAVYWTQRPSAGQPADPRVGHPVLDQAILPRVTRIEVSDQGKQVTLVRQPDHSWSDPGYYGLPADFSKLSGLISDLTSAKIVRLVSTDPVVLARLEFKDTAIRFFGRGGKPIWSLVLGKTDENGGRFIRYGDERKAYLASLDTYVDSDAKDWANAALLNLKADDVARIEVPFAAGGPVVLSRAKAAEPWTSDRTPRGDQVKADAAANLLSTLGQLSFTDTSAPDAADAAAARRHERAFRLTTFAGATYTVALGRRPEEKKAEPAPKPAKGGKPAAPKVTTIPAGPVYAFISCSNPRDPVNALMKRRAFQVDEYTFTSLPQTSADLFEAAPPAPKPAEAKPAAKAS